MKNQNSASCTYRILLKNIATERSIFTLPKWPLLSFPDPTDIPQFKENPKINLKKFVKIKNGADTILDIEAAARNGRIPEPVSPACLFFWYQCFHFFLLPLLYHINIIT